LRHRFGPLVTALDLGTGGALVAFGGLLGFRAARDRR
jgi:hypothetical protein